MKLIKEWNLVIAWLIALIGTMISLFYTVIALQIPCDLCWYQRIALFPLAIQLAIAAYRRDEPFALYAYPLCLIGFLTAVYQALLPLWPIMQKSCGIHGECTTRIPHLFGVPLPWVSALGFLLIAFFLGINRFSQSK